MQRPGPAASKIALLPGVLALAAACSGPRPDIIQVGPWFEPRSPEEVAVFSSRDETSRPWGAVAIIHSARFPQDDKKSVEKNRKQATIMAAEIGADGLILNVEPVTERAQTGVYREAEVYISALAFKYADGISTAPKK